MTKLNLLIVGGGMYVSGRGTKGYGTILPSIFKLYEKNILDKLYVSVTNLNSANKTKKKFKLLFKDRYNNKKINFFPNNKNNFNYLEIAKLYKPNCAIICVPDHMHSKICIDLGNIGIHCLVVKPMCLKVSEASNMIKTFSKNKVYGAVEFHKRFDEANIYIKELIKKNKLGKLQYANITYSQKKIIPEKIFKLWSKDSNVFNYLGVHYVDLLIFLTDFKPTELIAYGQKDYLIKKNIDTYDSMQVLIKWKRNDSNSFISTHLTNWIDPNNSSAMSNQKISIVGSLGRVDSDQKNRGLNINLKEENTDVNPYFCSVLDFNDDLQIFGYGIKSVIKFVENIYELKLNKISLKQLNSNTPSLKNCLDTVKITEAVTKSLIYNKKIKI